MSTTIECTVLVAAPLAPHPLAAPLAPHPLAAPLALTAVRR